MTSSCLNRTLISNALAGTGANISLLIHALTPLCPKPPPPIEALANSLTIVVVGYTCGFLPWGFLTLVDFISAKWKTVRATRRAGLLHLVGSVLPMVFVVAYAVMQGLSGDYKEMMTAVIAGVLTMYHMGRTVWGLAQLREYMKWCEYALQCIRATRPKSLVPEFENDTDDEEDDEGSNLDGELMVNSDVVDNEFSGRDISVTLSWRNWPMKVSNPAVCTVRWAAAFLCSLGHSWRSKCSEPLPCSLEFALSNSTLFIDDGPVKMRLSSFVQFSDILFNYGSNCGAFRGRITEYLTQGFQPFKSYTFEFENIVSSFPASNHFSDFEQNRLDARIEAVEYILALGILGPPKLRSIASHSETLRERFCCYEQISQAFDLLQAQIGIESGNIIDCSHLHSFWKLTIVPVCSAIPNAFILQSSAVVDNEESIEFALLLLGENFEGMQLVDDDAFEFCSNLLKSRDFPFDRYFLGVSLDCVRALLAHWVLRHEVSINKMTWFPTVSTDEIQFLASEYLSFISRRENKDDFFERKVIITECQQVVHAQILEHGTETQHLPTSLPMIVLVILSYPALRVKRTDDEQSSTEASETAAEYKITAVLARQTLCLSPFGNQSKGDDYQCLEEISDDVAQYEIRPMLAPQNLHLSLYVNANTGESSLSIVTEEDNINFDWEKWTNAALALMKSHNQIVKSRQSERTNYFVGPLELIKKVDLSRPMLKLSPSEEDAELSDLPGDVHLWTAWPIFDVRFCQFELHQWMVACGPLPKFYFRAGEEYKRRKRMAMKTLRAVASWDRT